MALLGTTLGLSTAGAGRPPCAGDCNNNGRVEISDLVLAVNVAILGDAAPQTCTSADQNGDGIVAINELVQAVNNALNGCLAPTPTATPGGDWYFTEVAVESGAGLDHLVDNQLGDTVAARSAAAAAAGDYNGDGRIDLYVSVGDAGPAALLRNDGDDNFVRRDAQAGLPVQSARGAAFAFADIDGDDTLDLFTAEVDGGSPRIFGGRTDGTFSEETSASNFEGLERDTHDVALADIDRDGDVDLCMTHWGTSVDQADDIEHVYRNGGDWRFEPVGISLGVTGLSRNGSDSTFAADFADLNDDGWQDLVFAAQGGSEVFLNDTQGAFVRATDDEIATETGRASALGDVDNDGDIDWFVSATWDPNGIAEGAWEVLGNRLYANRGDGSFEDVTEGSGVREGFWGRDACFADFDNDGDLDLFQVNGAEPAESDEFDDDPSRLFINRGDGTFDESAEQHRLIDRSQGRSVSCFDYDRDGDIDIFLTVNDGPSQLWRNDGGNRQGNHIIVRLDGRAPNTRAIGARITVISGGDTQIREVSSDLAEAHFGLGADLTVDEIRVRWPRGATSSIQSIAANQVVVVPQP